MMPASLQGAVRQLKTWKLLGIRAAVRSRIRRRSLAGESERVVGLTVRCPNLTPPRCTRIEKATRGGRLDIDGTKIKANASKHKTMSYGRMRTQADAGYWSEANVGALDAKDLPGPLVTTEIVVGNSLRRGFGDPSDTSGRDVEPVAAILLGLDHRINGLAQHILSAGGRFRIARAAGATGGCVEERHQPANDRWHVGCLRPYEEKGDGGRGPLRDHVAASNVMRDGLREGGSGRFPCLGGGDLDAKARERDAITQSLSFLHLQVDEESKQQVVDDDRSGVGAGPKTMPFAHNWCRLHAGMRS